MAKEPPKPTALSTPQKLLKFLRLNILFIAIGFGASVYFSFRYFSFLAPIKYPLKYTVDTLIPSFIFFMLFIAFCKVEIRQMRPRRWHYILIGLQLGVPALLVSFLHFFGGISWRLELEAFIACVISPTAAAASVITGKLGGDESSITTYTIMSNLASAIGIPLLFPFISTSEHDFFSEFLLIMYRIFPIIVLPLVIAQLLRRFTPKFHAMIVATLKDTSFYIWALTLSIVSATAISNIMNSDQSATTLMSLALVGLVTTALQFASGKLIGNFEGQRISAGQGFGQKNMVFGIWVTASYLSPAASIAPGCYILWQNMVNSWQLWYRDKKQLTYTDKR